MHLEEYEFSMKFSSWMETFTACSYGLSWRVKAKVQLPISSLTFPTSHFVILCYKKNFLLRILCRILNFLA